MNKTGEDIILYCFYSKEKSKNSFITYLTDFQFKYKLIKIGGEDSYNISTGENSFILFLDLPKVVFLSKIDDFFNQRRRFRGIAKTEDEANKFHELGIVHVLIDTGNDLFVRQQLDLLFGLFQKERDLDTISKDLEDRHQMYISQVNKIKSLSSAVDEPILFINKVNQIVFYNRKAQQVFGYSKYEIVNEDLFQWIVASKSKEFLKDIISSTLSKKTTVIKDNVNIFVRNKLGVEFEMNASITLHKIKSKEHNLVFVFHDIQQPKKLERELLKNRELWEETKILKEFIRQIAHDLRTPMNSIIGLAKTLQKYNAENLNKRQKEGLKIIEESGKQLVALTSDILDISRLDRNKLQLNYEKFSLGKQLSLQKSQTLQLIDQNSVKFIIKKSPTIPDILYGDHRKIFQIVNNLVSNAVKFTPKGKIVLSCHFYDNKLFFEIADTGIGIRKELQKEIFEKFIQADSPFSKIGTGLGLNISKKLTEFMGGEISLESEFEKGTLVRFYVTLPELPEELKQEHTVTSQSELEIINYKPERKLILAIDDNHHNRFIYKLLTEKNNYNILLAGNGKAGLNAVKTFYPDLVILKMEIPDVHGVSILKEMIQHNKQIPVIAASDYNLPESLLSGKVYRMKETLEYEKVNILLNNISEWPAKSTLETLVIYDENSWISKLKNAQRNLSFIKNNNPELTYILINQVNIKNLIIEQLTISSNALMLALRLLSNTIPASINNIWLHQEGAPLKIIKEKINEKNNVTLYSREKLYEMLSENLIIEE